MINNRDNKNGGLYMNHAKLNMERVVKDEEEAKSLDYMPYMGDDPETKSPVTILNKSEFHFLDTNDEFEVVDPCNFQVWGETDANMYVENSIFDVQLNTVGLGFLNIHNKVTFKNSEINMVNNAVPHETNGDRGGDMIRSPEIDIIDSNFYIQGLSLALVTDKLVIKQSKDTYGGVICTLYGTGEDDQHQKTYDDDGYFALRAITPTTPCKQISIDTVGATKIVTSKYVGSNYDEQVMPEELITTYGNNHSYEYIYGESTEDMNVNYLELKRMYLVEFDLNGADGTVDSQWVDHGDKAIRVENPEKEGYVFAGWVDQNGLPFSFSTRVKRDYKLKAVWTTGGGSSSHSEHSTHQVPNTGVK